jgi:hypothetical protein
MIVARIQFLITAIPLLAGWSLFGQGSVMFENAGAGLNAPITNGLTGLRVSGSGFVAQLYYAPGTSALEADLTSLSGVAPFSGSPGYFFGGLRVTDANTPPGASATFQVRAWEAALGATFEEALANAPSFPNRVLGKSALFVNPTGTSGAPATLSNLNGFRLDPVLIPEPGLISLLVLLPLAALRLRRA